MINCKQNHKAVCFRVQRWFWSNQQAIGDRRYQHINGEGAKGCWVTFHCLTYERVPKQSKRERKANWIDLCTYARLRRTDFNVEALAHKLISLRCVVGFFQVSRWIRLLINDGHAQETVIWVKCYYQIYFTDSFWPQAKVSSVHAFDSFLIN